MAYPGQSRSGVATSMLRAGVCVLAAVAAAAAADGGTAEELTYAKVKLIKTWENGTVDTIEQMSGEELAACTRVLLLTSTHVRVFVSLGVRQEEKPVGVLNSQNVCLHPFVLGVQAKKHAHARTQTRTQRGRR